MKFFKKSVPKLNQGREIEIRDIKRICNDGERRVNFPGKGVECESCKNCCNARCQGITDWEYKNMQKIVWTVPIVLVTRIKECIKNLDFQS